MAKDNGGTISLADVLNAVQGIAQRVQSLESGTPTVPTSAPAPRRAAPVATSTVASTKVPSDPEYAKRSGWFRSSRTGAAMLYVPGKGRNVCLVAPEHVAALVETIKAGALDDLAALPEKYVASPDEFEASRARR
jgi:hypothetical protein